MVRLEFWRRGWVLLRGVVGEEVVGRVKGGRAETRARRDSRGA